MRLINVEAFLEREGLLRRGKRVNHRAKVLEFGDDEVTEYAILSHRWIEQEVDYNEIVELTKMDKERNEIRQRDGYRKILQSCEQAKKRRTKYPKSNGWPEWFSRGWTLPEMITPRDVQFFDKDWDPIGNKRTLSSILEGITRVLQHILTEGLSSNRPCIGHGLPIGRQPEWRTGLIR
ncbi:hypothetical protein SCLCIDRAFT_1006621 [Scleroderma citrinum Foug A]|uniref:Uncharacterized protein n=1 Tax=Scleroderma citrinum Foug A TaxID=1036808 RepID=A0A0C3AT62_9AGAM|nr:hypothetical protein SCLCIDRAFT_1006621 [Scleroderma citrinum Foug A]